MSAAQKFSSTLRGGQAPRRLTAALTQNQARSAETRFAGLGSVWVFLRGGGFNELLTLCPRGGSTWPHRFRTKSVDLAPAGSVRLLQDSFRDGLLTETHSLL